jgi:cell division protein FtsI/penicillin-binding protein 2
MDQEGEPVIEDLLLSAVGYDRLIISPLELGLAFSVFGNEGKLIEYQLVDAIQGISGGWHSPDGGQTVSSVISPETANAIRGLLFIDRGIAEFNTSVISGPESTYNSWYLALAPASDPLYAVVVVVENSGDLDDSKRVGRSLLRNVLDPKDS